MKFPIAFRIFAVINLLIFLFMCIVSVMVFAENEKIHIVFGYAQPFVALWILIATMAWMFASKSSYHFLYSLGVALFVLSSLWLLNMVQIIPNKLYEKDRIVFGVIFGILLLYPLFMIGTLFFGPVRKWTEKAFSPKHLLIFIGVLAITSAAITGIRSAFPKFKRYDVSQFVLVGDYQSQVISAENYRQYTLQYPVWMNGLVSTVNDGSYEYPNPQYVEFAYTSQLPFEYQQATKLVLKVNSDSKNLKLRFKDDKVAAYEIRPCDKNGTWIASETFYLGYTEPVLFYNLFDKFNLVEFTDETYYDEEVGYYDYEGDGDYDPYEGYNGKQITPETFPDFACNFFSNFDTEYSPSYFFDLSNAIEIGCNRKKFSFGMYKQGFAYILSSLKGGIQNFLNFYYYEPEYFIQSFTNKSFYLESDNETYHHFNFINPEIIRFAGDNLIPDAQGSLGSQTYQAIYDKVFKRFARMMVLSHNYVYGAMNVDAESKTYYEVSRYSDSFYGPSYLMEKYQGETFDGYGEYDQYSQNWEFIGFWLRRHIDNTDDEMWDLVSKVMNQYDSEWFGEMFAEPEYEGDI